MRRFFVLLALVGMVAGYAAPALAQINDDPTTSGTTGLFTIPRAGTVERGEWALGGYMFQSAREEGDSRIRRFGVSGAYGLTDRFEILVGFEPSVDIDRKFTAEAAQYRFLLGAAGGPFAFFIPDPVSGVAINEHPFAVGYEQSGFGDVWVGGKLKFVGDPYEYDGLAAMVNVKLPTSKTSEGIGTGAFSVDGRIIGSVEAWERLGWSAYLGYALNSTPDVDAKLNGIPLFRTIAGQPMIVLPTQWNYFVSDELLYGIGFQFPTRAQLQLIGEWNGRVTSSDMSAAYARGVDQSLLSLGLRLSTQSGFAVNAAANYEYNVKLGAKQFQTDPEGVEDAIRRWGMHIGVSYSTSRRMPLSYAGTAPMELPLLNAAPTLTCQAERTSLRQGESVRVMATTSDADGDSVEVMWDAAAGTLSSRTGDTVTWNTTGVPAGQGRIVGRANDGYGGVTDCEINVSVMAPPEPGEPTILEFMCAEFGSGSARIDNRCKAVLDDVALQMRQNPGATAVITGHSDSAGSDTANMTASEERATNAMTYLVDTHGIDAGRISTSGVGSGQAMADNSTSAGRSQNRRIEIVVTIPPR